MVAAFWDDADFSQGVGTTWYQVGSTRDVLLGDPSSQLVALTLSLANHRSTPPSALPKSPLSAMWKQRLRNT